MLDDRPIDYYEVLQVSTTAEPDTINRVYRLLAQRFHPDNQETGNDARFREIHEAYTILSDPEQRARYDIVHERQRQSRWRLVTTGANADNDFAMEQITRLTVLEALYTKRRVEPDAPSLFFTDLEGLTGRPREHLEFTVWFLVQKKLVTKDDRSRLLITAEGAEHLEQNYVAGLARKRLQASAE